ncbi:MAG: hypothetical protein ABEI75_00355 [Halobaculum sp.]
MNSDRSPWRSVALIAVATLVVGCATAAGLVVVPVAGSFVGTLVGAFLLGLGTRDRPLVAAAVGAVAARLALLAAGPLIGNGPLDGLAAFTAVEPTTLAISLGLSASVAAFGAHFGDDLQDGLTAPVEPPGGTTAPDAGTIPSPAREEDTTEATETEHDHSDTDRFDADRSDPDRSDTADDDPITDESDVELDRE